MKGGGMYTQRVPIQKKVKSRKGTPQIKPCGWGQTGRRGECMLVEQVQQGSVKRCICTYKLKTKNCLTTNLTLF